MTDASAATTCKLCWALVPRQLMHFHREWHASGAGFGRKVFEEGPPVHGSEVDDAFEIVALLRALGEEAGPKRGYVDQLREILLNEARALAQSHQRQGDPRSIH